MVPVAPAPRISDFFLRLGDDPDLLAEYGRDPGRTLAAHGLTAEQVEIVLAGDVQTVRRVVESEFATDPLRRRLVQTPRMVVHMEPEPEAEPKPKPEPAEPEPEPKPKPEPAEPDTEDLRPPESA